MSRVLLITAIITLAVPLARAQDSTPAHNKWEFLVEPYIMLPNMTGTAAVGTLPAVEVDASAEEILDHLHAGFMIYVEARKGEWTFLSDFLFMNLEANAEPSTVINSGTVSMGQGA